LDQTLRCFVLSPARAAAYAILSSLTLLCIFFAALMGSKTAGELAGALGSFIGGIIGAGGAVLAVYLTLSKHRKEDLYFFLSEQHATLTDIVNVADILP
jgi:hypothetical protein